MTTDEKLIATYKRVAKAMERTGTEINLLRTILVEQIGTHTVVTNQPDYDVSNVYPTFQFGDKVEVNGVGLRGTITGLYGTDEYFVKMPHDTFIYSGRNLIKVA